MKPSSSISDRSIGASSPTGTQVLAQPLAHTLDAHLIRDEQFARLEHQLRYRNCEGESGVALSLESVGDSLVALAVRPRRESMSSTYEAIFDTLGSLDDSQGLLSAGRDLAGIIQGSISKLPLAQKLIVSSSLTALGQWCSALSMEGSSAWATQVVIHAVSILAKEEQHPLIKMSLVATRTGLQ